VRYALRAEDHYFTLAQYYGEVSMLSARPLALRLIESAPGNFSRFSAIYHDTLGHMKDAGHRLVADMVISLFQKTMLGALSQAALRSEQQPLAGGAASGQQGGAGGGSNTCGGAAADEAAGSHWGCGGALELQQLAGSAGLLPGGGGAGARPPPLPLPLLLASADQPGGLCRVDSELQALAVASHGFAWVDEGRHGASKWGFSAGNAGSWLELRLSTVVVGGQRQREEGRPPAHVKLVVMYLRSYEHMGAAEVSCASGCSCGPAVAEGHWPAKSSQPDMLQVANVTQHPACVLRVRVKEESLSGGHRFKLVGVIVGAEGFSEGQAERVHKSLKYVTGAAPRYGQAGR
jgi:hypothetical protein